MDIAPVWTCPICREGLFLKESGKSWACENNHSFDRAREGYVNLLPSNKKRSGDPGDNAEMIAARRRIHSAQIYQPLAQAVTALVAELEPIKQILDLGCGEGYYSNALQQAKPAARIAGVDISRPAIKLAAKRYPAVKFAVASTFALPVSSESQDLLVRIFAPSEDTEILRALKQGAVYLEVTPAPRHLWALREALYDTPRTHADARQTIAGMSLCKSSTLEFEVELGHALLHDLVAMTPFAHRGHRGKREGLLALDSLAVQMAFSLNLFQR